MFRGVGVATAGLMEQLLQGAPVLEGLRDLRGQFIGHVDAGAAPIRSDVQDVAGMFLAAGTGGAVLSGAGARSMPQ